MHLFLVAAILVISLLGLAGRLLNALARLFTRCSRCQSVMRAKQRACGVCRQHARPLRARPRP